jgi:hypothetical protein
MGFQLTEFNNSPDLLLEEFLVYTTGKSLQTKLGHDSELERCSLELCHPIRLNVRGRVLERRLLQGMPRV